MIENASDFLSIALLSALPIGVSIYLIYSLLKKRRVHRKEKEGKYYPEW